MVNEFENLGVQYSKSNSGVSIAKVKVFLESKYFNKILEKIKETAH